MCRGKQTGEGYGSHLAEVSELDCEIRNWEQTSYSRNRQTDRRTKNSKLSSAMT